MKKLNFKLEDYLINDERYDYDRIVKDFVNTGSFQNNYDLIKAVVYFGRGHLLYTLTESAVIKFFNNNRR